MKYLTIEVPVRPFSLNAERTEHRFARAKRVSYVRHLACVRAERAIREFGIDALPLFDVVKVEVRPWALTRQFRQDPGNCFPTYKACLDGFVDAGLLRDDTQRYVSSIEFFPHQFGHDGMELTLLGTLYDHSREARQLDLLGGGK